MNREPDAPAEPAPDSIRGSVFAYDAGRGFGFLIGENGKRYFFHFTDVIAGAPCVVGARVEFEPGGQPRRWRARLVRRVALAAPEPLEQRITSHPGLSPALTRRLEAALSRWGHAEEDPRLIAQLFPQERNNSLHPGDGDDHV